MYEIGDVYSDTKTITDSSTPPVPVASGTVTCTITLPDLTVVSPTVTNPSTGVYSIAYPITQAGQHLVNWVGLAPNQWANSDVFNAAPTNPGFIISLAEARKGIGFTASNTLSDDDLREFIQAATPIMEDLIGSVTLKTRVETYDGGSPTIALLASPVMSITEIIESAGSSYERTLTPQDIFSGGGSDSYGYTADLGTGIVTRRASGVAVNFLYGRRNIRVTYVSGRVLTSNQLMATRRLVKFLWQSEQENYSPSNMSPESIGRTPNGSDVPLIVLSLCADSQRPQGIG